MALPGLYQLLLNLLRFVVWRCDVMIPSTNKIEKVHRTTNVMICLHEYL